MKPTTLKKLLKPPFTRSGFSIYDKTGRVLELCDIFTAYNNNAELSDQFAMFVIEALNKKWERDNLKQKRDKIDEVILLLENRWRDIFKDIENGEQLQNKLMECVIKTL